LLAPQLREARRSAIGSRPGGAAEEESERRRRTERREGRGGTRSASGSSPGVAAEEADGEEGRARATEVATMARRADGGRGGEASIGDGEGMSVVPGGGAGSAGAWEMRCAGSLRDRDPRRALMGAGFVGDGGYGERVRGERGSMEGTEGTR